MDSFETLADKTAAMLGNGARLAVPIQPCVRDIWHNHLLFQGDRVSGIVDFGALCWDNVAIDIARLFGSLVGDDPLGWETALAAYSRERRLSDNERALVLLFDQSTVLLSGMHWLWWVYVERREFEARQTVLERLDVTIDRLRYLSEKREH
jgi:homoserine kinase type II